MILSAGRSHGSGVVLWKNRPDFEFLPEVLAAVRIVAVVTAAARVPVLQSDMPG